MKYFMMGILWFIIFMLLLENADAGEEKTLYLFHNVYTDHPNSDGFLDKNGPTKYNEDNNVTGLRYAIDDTWSVGVGVGENSYYEEMVVGGVEYRHRIHRWLDAGVDILASTGYEEQYGMKVIAVPMPFLRVGNDYYKAKVGVIGVFEVVTVNLEVKLYQRD